ncbi:MAG: hypothetical protein AAF387_18620 [Pseudomonadota bacterium]
MGDKTWKAAERAIAKILGGERVPITGRARGSASDIEHDWLSLEVKHRKKLPDWLHDAMSQAKASQRGAQLPMVVLHENGQRYGESYAVVPMAEFVKWFGR